MCGKESLAAESGAVFWSHVRVVVVKDLRQDSILKPLHKFYGLKRKLSIPPCLAVFSLSQYTCSCSVHRASARPFKKRWLNICVCWESWMLRFGTLMCCLQTKEGNLELPIKPSFVRSSNSFSCCAHQLQQEEDQGLSMDLESGMTLRTLRAWMFDPIMKLKILAALVDICQGRVFVLCYISLFTHA